MFKFYMAVLRVTPMSDQRRSIALTPRSNQSEFKNYRALHNLQLKPLTVLLGPSGSGESTVLSPPGQRPPPLGGL